MSPRDDPKWEPGACDNCAWFSPHDVVSGGVALGTCRVKSPVPVEEWPETLGTEWCGEWAYAGDKLRRGPGRYRGPIENLGQAKDPGPMVTFKVAPPEGKKP